MPPITASLVAACVLVSVGCTDPTTVTAPVGSTDADHITPVYFPDQGTGDFDVASYDVEATVSIDGTDRLDATATIVATAMDDLARIRLDLDGLTVTGATVDGRAAQIERTEHTLEIVPPTTVSAGDEFVAVVTYGGAPAGGEDPATVLEDLGGGWLDLGAYSAVVAEPTAASTWLPVNDRPSDKATFALSVTVPAPLVAVSNGELVERVDQGGNTRFRWTAPEPMAPYLMTLVVGALDLVERRVPGGPSVIGSSTMCSTHQSRAARLVRKSCVSSFTHVAPNTAQQAINASQGPFDIVIMKTGYNDGSSTAENDVRTIVAAARAKGAKLIIWMTFSESTVYGRYDAQNAVLRRLAASPEFPDLVVADWRGYAAASRGWYASDRLHLLGLGVWATGDYLSRWVAYASHLACPKPWTVGGAIDNPCPNPDGVHAFTGTYAGPRRTCRAGTGSEARDRRNLGPGRRPGGR